MGWDGNGNGMRFGGSRVEQVRVGWDQEKLCGIGKDQEGADGSRMGVGVIG